VQAAEFLRRRSQRVAVEGSTDRGRVNREASAAEAAQRVWTIGNGLLASPGLSRAVATHARRALDEEGTASGPLAIFYPEF
jgi:hypothetical protein